MLRNSEDLSIKVKKFALDVGADLVGVCDSLRLKENLSELQKILPSHKSFIAIAIKHTTSALNSNNLRVKQYDTIYTYDQVRAVTQKLARLLEIESFKAVAIPPFLPIDMTDDKLGMIGDIDLRRASVLAGLGVYGRSGLLVTKHYGSKVRLGGVLTDASLKSEHNVFKHQTTVEEICGSCHKCVEVCPAQALKGDGTIDKKKCGSKVFEYGLRGFVSFLENLSQTNSESIKKLTRSYTLRELWQNFMTGNYYYCWECQAVCLYS